MSRLFENAGLTYVTVSPSASINNLAQRTYMSWVKLVSYGVFIDSSLYARGLDGATYFDISDGATYAPGLCYYGNLHDEGTDPYSQVYVVDPTPLDVWTHLAITYDQDGDKKLHYFVNGVEVSEYSIQTEGSGTLADDSAEDFIIGNFISPAPDSLGLDGRLYDFRLYDSILTEADLAAIIAGGINTNPGGSNLVLQLTFADDEGSTEPDASGNNNDGVITGATFSSDNPVFAGPSTVGAVFPGPYRGDTLAEAFKNASNQDILQIVNQGGDVIWNLSSDGTATDNPGSATPDAVLAKLQADSFAEAFKNPYQLNILQVIGQGGNIIFYVDYQGNAAVV